MKPALDLLTMRPLCSLVVNEMFRLHVLALMKVDKDWFFAHSSRDLKKKLRLLKITWNPFDGWGDSVDLIALPDKVDSITFT